MENVKKPIYVTQPSLPPINEFFKSIHQIWESKILTNNGPFHQQLEYELSKYLGVEYISLFSNGTLALMTALQALNIKGEVITTPYSFVATTHSLWWNNIKPVFSDIEPNYLNLDPKKVEASITHLTSAIMPVHVYGNPCNIEMFQKIALKHNLKLIYDAAHAVGVKINGESILKYGDLSIVSFHATKVFNTIEGGAIISPDAETKNRIDHLKNFGFIDEITVIEPGINAKMNEVQAAFGLLQIKYIDEFIEKRKSITNLYRHLLKDIQGISFLEDIKGVQHNYSYFPIFVNKDKYGKSRDEIYDELKNHNIFGRRYFHPLISQFPYYKDLESSKPGRMPIAERTAEEVICLPLYAELHKDIVRYICDLLRNI
jgi:dTDP-4-amino-4,6-dideoxygalactose transaminase